jgi:hypothetical protein
MFSDKDFLAFLIPAAIILLFGAAIGICIGYVMAI